MYTEDIVIENATGLHARPAAKLVELSNKFKSEITVTRGDKVASAKSIFSILGAGIGAGATVTLKIEGVDEPEAAKTLSEYLHNLPD